MCESLTFRLLLISNWESFLSLPSSRLVKTTLASDCNPLNLLILNIRESAQPRRGVSRFQLDSDTKQQDRSVVSFHKVSLVQLKNESLF
jgi:hypothetical protein